MEAAKHFSPSSEDERELHLAELAERHELHPEVPDLHDEALRVAEEDAAAELVKIEETEKTEELLNQTIAREEHELADVALQAFADPAVDSDIDREQYEGSKNYKTKPN